MAPGLITNLAGIIIFYFLIFWMSLNLYGRISRQKQMINCFPIRLEKVIYLNVKNIFGAFYPRDKQ